MKKFLMKWNEFITIPLGLILVFWAEKIVTTVYPTSTRYDVGFHYDLIYSIASWLILHGIAYFVFKINWSKMEQYIDVDLNEEFGNLTHYQKIKFSITLFFAYLFSAILTFLAVSLS